MIKEHNQLWSFISTIQFIIALFVMYIHRWSDGVLPSGHCHLCWARLDIQAISRHSRANLLKLAFMLHLYYWRCFIVDGSISDSNWGIYFLMQCEGTIIPSTVLHSIVYVQYKNSAMIFPMYIHMVSVFPVLLNSMID